MVYNKSILLLIILSSLLLAQKKSSLQMVSPSLRIGTGINIEKQAGFQLDILTGPLFYVRNENDYYDDSLSKRNFSRSYFILIPQIGYTRINTSVESSSYKLFSTGGTLSFSKNRTLFFTLRGSFLIGKNDITNTVTGGLGALGLDFRDGIWGIATSIQRVDDNLSFSLTANFDILLITVGQLLGAGM